MNEWIWRILAAMCGGIINQIWYRYRTRLITIPYRTSLNALITTLPDLLDKHIQLSLSGNPIRNLYNATFSVSNNSSKDLKNIDFEINCDTSSTLIVTSAFKSSSPHLLDYSSKYKQRKQNKTPENNDYLMYSSEFNIPVFNRGDEIKMHALITNKEGKVPAVWLNCEHEGVRVKYKTEPQYLMLGESFPLLSLIGLIIALVSTSLIVLCVQNNVIAILLITPILIFCGYMGVVLIKIGRLIKKLFT